MAQKTTETGDVVERLPILAAVLGEDELRAYQAEYLSGETEEGDNEDEG